MYKLVFFINNVGNIILVWELGDWIKFCVCFWYFVKVKIFVGL